MRSTDNRFRDADGDIWQHMVRNDDWSHQYLLCDRLNLLGCDDSTFLRFLETCVHPLAVQDENEAGALAHVFNEYLEKDGYKLVVTSRISGRPVYTAVDSQSAFNASDHSDVYEVVLSFAGEDRTYVEQVAGFLRERDVRCFYDRYEDVTLWGKDLAEHLDKLDSGKFSIAQGLSQWGGQRAVQSGGWKIERMPYMMGEKNRYSRRYSHHVQSHRFTSL